MGQVTSPILNRTSRSMLWLNTWQSPNLYQIFFSNDLSLKRFFFIFWRIWLSFLKHHTYFLKYKVLSSTSVPFSYISFFEEDRFILTKLLKTVYKKFTYYVSRVFILRYNNVTILYLYTFVPFSFRTEGSHSISASTFLNEFNSVNYYIKKTRKTSKFIDFF